MPLLRRSILLVSSALLLSAAAATQVAVFAQTPTAAQTPAPASAVTMPPAPLLPDSFGPWHASGNADNALTFDGSVAKELLVQRTDAKTYRVADSNSAEGATAVVSAVQMTDSTGAYSGWTLKRTADMRPCAGGNSLGSNCAVAAGKLLFWQGNTLLQIAPSGTHAVSAGSFSDLLAVLPKPVGAKGAPPLLPTRLPQRENGSGLLPETVHYSVGPQTYAAAGGTLPAALLSFDKSPEILTARYTGKSGNGLLTSIFYPTPTIAGVAQHTLEKAIADGTLPPGMLAGAPTVRRSGPIVALVTGDFTKAQAAKLADSVKYEAEVTWNKPEGYMDQFTISRTGSVMVQIIILVLTVVAAAAVLGVVFGGGRALIRKAQGKPASSLADAEIIKLDLRGRPEKLQS